jgi:hypothetical protein
VYENVLEYAEDIYPYATFHVANAQPQNSPANFQTFMYQDQRYPPSGRESIPLKSVSSIEVLKKIKIEKTF